MIVLTLHTRTGKEAARIVRDSPTCWHWSGSWGAGSGSPMHVATSVRTAYQLHALPRIGEDAINRMAPKSTGEERDALLRLAGLVVAIELQHYAQPARRAVGKGEREQGRATP